MSMQRKTLPIGVQDFRGLIEDQYLYIDKTEYIYNLVHSGKQFFLSRPRRFGKSLLLSTMAAYWEGRKELFSGLAIERLEGDRPDAWESYPVFYFDFNKDNLRAENAIENILDEHLKGWESVYGCVDPTSTLAGRFANLLRSAYESTGRRCVVLVDEYDKPLLELIDNEQLREHNRAVFKGFFSLLKSYDRYLQFVFITGVTKFSKVSIFSDLNQLDDISLDEEYAGICGITEDELTENFAPEIQALSEKQGISTEECLDKLRRTYDGYHFSGEGEGVYNPYSLLLTFRKKKFGSYWFETGTPTFLMKRMKDMNYDVRKFSDQSLEITESALSDCREDNPDPVPLLYHHGYLTIIPEKYQGDWYTLEFPNEEVRSGFLNNYLAA